MIKRIYLEITNSCNLNCHFCEAVKHHDFMALEDIKKLLIQIKEFTNYVYLHILGEPLLHPMFDAILSFCDELNLNIQLVSNGTLLSKYPNILDHKSLRKLSISIHSIDNICIDATYFDTINNLIEIIQNKQDQYLELRFYDYQNLHQNAKKYHDYLSQKYTFNETKKQNSYYIAKNVFVFYQNLFHWPNINDPFISEEGICHGALEMLGILANKDVVICCLDPSGHTKIGNLNNDTLKEVLNSDKYIEIVENMKKSRLTNPLCQRCTYRLRFDKAYK